MPILLASCETDYYDYFIITNRCDENIEVDVTFSNERNNNMSFPISANSEFLFFSENWDSERSRYTNSIFKSIAIRKGDSTSPINYADDIYWEKVKVQNSWGCRISFEVYFYLYINPEDF